ncbi:amidohydrolase family protein [Abyssisolibacter fermentans]|uniref:amidohydrolase family protein n=1 Tax=Abyssisolibacter fermentans TaxID=1766203 RepID=UPI000833775E|nr:amidohydrolase family protein [Abyssisolibacter fermentans]
MIIDIHSHLTRNKITKKYAIEELIDDMNKNNIDVRAISTFEGSSIKDQNDTISKYVQEYKDRLIGFAVINPKEDNALEETKRALELPGIIGVEFDSVQHGYYPDSTESITAILEEVERHDGIVKVFTGIGAMSMPQQWAVYAKKFPNIVFIMLHMGCFDYGYSCVDLAVDYENIYLETSNQYEVQILKKAFNNVSEDKILYGSQFPNKFTKNSINLFDFFKIEDSKLEKILYSNSSKLIH